MSITAIGAAAGLMSERFEYFFSSRAVAVGRIKRFDMALGSNRQKNC
jgi:hypothetical protein